MQAGNAGVFSKFPCGEINLFADVLTVRSMLVYETPGTGYRGKWNGRDQFWIIFPASLRDTGDRLPG